MSKEAKKILTKFIKGDIFRDYDDDALKFDTVSLDTALRAIDIALKQKKNIPTKSCVNAEVKIREDIYRILHKEAHNWFEIINTAEENTKKRLNAIEHAAMPYYALEELKTEINKLQYSIGRNTKAIEDLLNFFNASKNFLNNENIIRPE